jgi:hypothetical protein
VPTPLDPAQGYPAQGYPAQGPGTRFLIDGCQRLTRVLILHCNFQYLLMCSTHFSESERWFLLLFTCRFEFLTFWLHAEKVDFYYYLHTNLSLFPRSPANKLVFWPSGPWSGDSQTTQITTGNSFFVAWGHCRKTPMCCKYGWNFNFWVLGPGPESSHMFQIRVHIYIYGVSVPDQKTCTCCQLQCKIRFLDLGARVGKLAYSVNCNIKLNFWALGPRSESSHML